MRRILAVGCLALYLVFGFVTGLAHVHESADHHEESRGLHLDHDHGSGSPGDAEARFDDRHVDHHDGDAVYLNATAARSFDASERSMPALVSVGRVDPPSPAVLREDAMADPPCDPPRKIPPRLRAPPA